MVKASVSSLTDLAGKKVLVRCDLNVPLDDSNNITDDTRIRAAIPTLQHLMAGGAKVAVCSHLGRPKSGPEEKFSLAPCAVSILQMGKESEAVALVSISSGNSLRSLRGPSLLIGSHPGFPNLLTYNNIYDISCRLASPNSSAHQSPSSPTASETPSQLPSTVSPPAASSSSRTPDSTPRRHRTTRSLQRNLLPLLIFLLMMRLGRRIGHMRVLRGLRNF